MTEIWQGFLKAVELIITFDREVMEIALRSLSISLLATLIASILCIPLGGILQFYFFTGKRALISLIQTFYSVPTVLVGLFVFLLFSRLGPLGGLNLLFTPTIMVLGQAILITPILIGLTISALSGVDKSLKDTALSLGATNTQAIITIIKEARFSIISAILLAFGRAISEVGCVIMVGGNIRGFTRVLTTAIALETQRGEIELSLALGLILLLISLTVNLLLNIYQQRKI